MFEIGRICMKVAGREAGRFCVVVEKGKDKEFVVITGPRIITEVRRRKCNVRHLEPTPFKIAVKENATDNDVMNAFDKDDVYKKLKLQKPTAEQIKLAEESAARHKEKEKKKEDKPKKEEKKAEEPKKEKKPEMKEKKPEKKKVAKPKKRVAKKPAKKSKK